MILTKSDLLQLMVDLEFANEELRVELATFDRLMRKVGFADGIATIKATVRELQKEEKSNEDT